MSKRSTWLLALGLVVCVCGVCIGDTILFKDGTTVNGTVVSQDDASVVVEVQSGGKTVTKTYNRDLVSSVIKRPPPGAAPASAPASKPAPVAPVPIAKKADRKPEIPGMPLPPSAPPLVAYDKPTYYLIPFKGAVGRTVTGTMLAESFADAATRKPSAVVIEMDSPGGFVGEVESMLDAISKAKKDGLVTVVLAKNAISAAAVTSLAAEKIYMKPGGIIGAATPYKIDEIFGMPENIGEKMESVWRAAARGAAERGGHDSLIAEAMIDSRMSLYQIAGTDGKKSLAERGSKGDKLVKTPGKLLTMTAREAVDIGLAAGMVDDIAELGKALDLEGWVECKGRGVPLAEYYQKRSDFVEKEYKRLISSYKENMAKARANDPDDLFPVTDSKGRLTPQFIAQRHDRAMMCIAMLKQAEDDLEKAAVLADKFPQLLPDAEELRAHRRALTAFRTAKDAQNY